MDANHRVIAWKGGFRFLLVRSFEGPMARREIARIFFMDSPDSLIDVVGGGLVLRWFAAVRPISRKFFAFLPPAVEH